MVLNFTSVADKALPVEVCRNTVMSFLFTSPRVFQQDVSFLLSLTFPSVSTKYDI